MTRTWLMYTAFLIAVMGSIVAMPVWTILTWAQEPSGMVVRSYLAAASVRAGEALPLKGYVLLPQGCRIVVMRRIYNIDGAIIFAASERFVPDVDNSPITIRREINIPVTASPGEAAMHRIVEWQCNWPQVLFPRQRELPTLRFTITEGDGS